MFVTARDRRRFIHPENGNAPPTPGPPTNHLVLRLEADTGTSTTTNNQPISSWTDQVASSVWSQATANKQPLYIANAINGLPIVRFDGTNDVLAPNAAIEELNTAQLSIFFVAKTTNGTANVAPVFGNTNGSTTGVIFNLGTNHTNMNLNIGTGSTITFITDPSAIGTAFNLFAGIIDSTAVNKQVLRRNGVQTAQGNNNYAPVTTHAIPELGGLLNTYYITMDLAALLIYDTGLALAEIEAVESYLSTKYGL